MRANICCTLFFSLYNQRLENEKDPLPCVLIRFFLEYFHTPFDEVILDADFVLSKVMIEAVVDLNKEVNSLLDNRGIDALKGDVPYNFKFV